jgi:hypothetical protein
MHWFSDKSFKRRRLLDYHMRSVHTGERPYQCEECNATFVYPEHFKKHKRIHTGEKPFRCEVRFCTFDQSPYYTKPVWILRFAAKRSIRGTIVTLTGSFIPTKSRTSVWSVEWASCASPCSIATCSRKVMCTTPLSSISPKCRKEPARWCTKRLRLLEFLATKSTSQPKYYSIKKLLNIT